MADSMSVDKKEDLHERAGSDDSLDSMPEPEADAPQENATQQKRKGGRKPIYATSEERKQRNRQAQAAFRERRTEYIKQLEETIRVHETNLHNLQTAHRSAADECLMLRYKNSLLERVLLEKGIDVQAELQAKTGSPHLGPVMPNMAQAPTIQRAIMNRHHQARRSNSNIAPKVEPLQSPHSRHTPSSHASSPTSNSPGFNSQIMSPPASDIVHPHQAPRLLPLKTQVPLGLTGAPGPSPVSTGGMVGAALGPPKGHGSSGAGGTGGPPAGAAYYTHSPFQTHLEQLDQEYDAQTDMVDDHDATESGPGPYPAAFPPTQHQMDQQQAINQQQQPGPGVMGQQQPGQGFQMAANPQGYPSMTQLLDPLDPMLDLDPFGLSASMQFPTQFSFDTSSMR